MSKKQGLKGYEQIAEYLMNGETEKARSLFHDIVVESSREIYESLIDDSDFATLSDNQTDDLISDISTDVASDEVMDSVENPQALGSVLTAEEAKHLLDWLDGTVTESDNTQLIEKVASFYGVQAEAARNSLEENTDELLDVAYGKVTEEPMNPAGMPMAGDEPAVDPSGGMDDMGDMGDEPMGDEPMGDDPMGDELGGEEGGEGEIEDRVMDLEDALDELKAEFDHLMSQEEDEPNHDFSDMPGSEEEGDEEGSEEGEEGDELGGEEGSEEGSDDMSDVPSDEPAEKPKFEARSATDLMREYVEKVSAPSNTEGAGVGSKGKEATVNTKSTVAGKNDMGGTTKNMVKGGSNAAPDGTSAPKSDEKPGNLPGAGKYANVPGAKAGQTFKDAKKPVSTEPSGVNKKSMLGK